MNTTQATQQWADRILASLELTREQIRKHVVSIAAGINGDADRWKLTQIRHARGLNARGDIPLKERKNHQDLGHLPMRERRRIIAQRRRDEKKAAKLASQTT